MVSKARASFLMIGYLVSTSSNDLLMYNTGRCSLSKFHNRIELTAASITTKYIHKQIFSDQWFGQNSGCRKIPFQLIESLPVLVGPIKLLVTL